MSKQIQRGDIKKFREYLNLKYAVDLSKGEGHRNFRYHQVSRQYGDYLYRQDREMFNECLGRWKNGVDV